MRPTILIPPLNPPHSHFQGKRVRILHHSPWGLQDHASWRWGRVSSERGQISWSELIMNSRAGLLLLSLPNTCSSSSAIYCLTGNGYTGNMQTPRTTGQRPLDSISRNWCYSILFDSFSTPNYHRLPLSVEPVLFLTHSKNIWRDVLNCNINTTDTSIPPALKNVVPCYFVSAVVSVSQGS